MRNLLTTIFMTALLLGLSGTPGYAADAAQKFAVHGIGAESCSRMVEAMQKEKDYGPALTSWIFGYLSAINRLTPGVYDISPITEAQGMTAVVYGECRQNPTLPVQAIVASVFDALSKASVRAASPLIEAKAGGKTVAVRAETLVTMETALAASGRYDGKPDGTFGPKLEAALRAYQRAEKLPETGLPDAPTILRLLVDTKPPPTAAKAKK